MPLRSELQPTTAPEAGAGLGGIEIQQSRIVFIRQCQRVPLGIQQVPHPGEQRVGLTIAAAAIGKEKDGVATQLKRASCQVRDGIHGSIIDSQRSIATQREIRS